MSDLSEESHLVIGDDLAAHTPMMHRGLDKDRRGLQDSDLDSHTNTYTSAVE